MARRLIEAGVSFVEVTLGSVGNDIFGWDTHQNNFTAVKALSAELDTGWGTLMKELAERDLLDSTTILWIGEFGRTPKINMQGGRDHFPAGVDLRLRRRRHQGRPGLRQDERQRRGSDRGTGRCARHLGDAMRRRRRRSRDQKRLRTRPADQSGRRQADSGHTVVLNCFSVRGCESCRCAFLAPSLSSRESLLPLQTAEPDPFAPINGVALTDS